MGLLLVGVHALALISAGTDGGYPLAAALVINDDVVVIDLPTRSAKPLGLKGLRPEEADLSPDKRYVAFNARPLDGGHLRIYLQDMVNGSREELRTPADGDNRFPRFADHGATLYFSAAKKGEPGGPHNPGRVFKMRMRDRGVTEAQTDPALCSFSPVGAGRHTVAHVSTPCAMAFDVSLTDERDGGTRTVASVSSPQAELAVSPDGKTLLYTSDTPTGRGIFKAAPGRKPALLADLGQAQSRVQPRFICPKDVLFYDAGTVWLLDSRSGKTEAVLDYPQTKHRQSENAR